MAVDDIRNNLLGVQNSLAALSAQISSLLVEVETLSVVPSNDGATIPNDPEIIDAALNQWRINNLGQITLDGVVQSGLNSIVLLLYYHGMVYCENASGSWFGLLAGTFQSMLNTRQDPRGIAISANGTSVSLAGAPLLDGLGNVWAINASRQAVINGVAQPGTSADQLLYYNGAIYIDTAGVWQGWNGSAFANPGIDPRLVTPPTYPAHLVAPLPAAPPGKRSYYCGVATGASVANYSTDAFAVAAPLEIIGVSSSPVDGTTPMVNYPAGSRFVVTWNVLLGSGTYWDLSRIASGVYDSAYVPWLQGMQSYNVAVIRLFPEFNGDWQPWSLNMSGSVASDGTPPGVAWSTGTFIAAWQHLATLIRRYLPNAKIEWPVASGNPAWANNQNSFDQYWPNGAYVDIVGINAYECHTGQFNVNGLYGARVNINTILSFAQDYGKFVGVWWAAANGDAAFIAAMARWLDANMPWPYYHVYVEDPSISGTYGTSDVLYQAHWPGELAAWNASSFVTKPYGISVAAAPPLPPPPLIGINLSGLEQASPSTPTNAQLDYYNLRGIELIRLPFSWERMQPTLLGALSTSVLASIDSLLAHAAKNGQFILLDCHNFGSYTISAVVYPLGSTTLTQATFVDLWTKMATHFKGKAGLYGFSLMNEPQGLANVSIWPNAAQAAVNAIRVVDATSVIVVDGDVGSLASNWSAPVVTDSGNNIIYDGHVWGDAAQAGTYANSYDIDAVTSSTMVNRITPFETWSTLNNRKIMIGEIGVPKTDARWLTMLDATLNNLFYDGIPAWLWAGGPGLSSADPLSLEPNSAINSISLPAGLTHDAEQMAIITKYTMAPQPSMYFFVGPASGFVAVPSTFTIQYFGILQAPLIIQLTDAAGPNLASVAHSVTGLPAGWRWDDDTTTITATVIGSGAENSLDYTDIQFDMPATWGTSRPRLYLGPIVATSPGLLYNLSIPMKLLGGMPGSSQSIGIESATRHYAADFQLTSTFLHYNFTAISDGTTIVPFFSPADLSGGGTSIAVRIYDPLLQTVAGGGAFDRTSMTLNAGIINPSTTVNYVAGSAGNKAIYATNQGAIVNSPPYVWPFVAT